MAKKLERPRKRAPADINANAFRIVAEATAGERPDLRLVPPPTVAAKPKKNRAAVALGRRGGKKGGKARAEALTPERRREIAIKAARKRWGMKDEE
ncbi:MAG TPA: hypothetical protein VGF86_05405 [Candidatus Tumulicola sp.]|jgi:hypothetical protein